EKAEAIVTAIIFGAELGLGPLASLQSIAVINGKPSIYGDAMLALCQRDSAYVSHDEGVEGDLKSDDTHGWCEVVVRNHGGGERRVRRTFSVADAKRAKLWSKAGPWEQYPQRMLLWRARTLAFRDALPGALKGLPTYEEAIDLEPSQYSVHTSPAAPTKAIEAPAARSE